MMLVLVFCLGCLAGGLALARPLARQRRELRALAAWRADAEARDRAQARARADAVDRPHAADGAAAERHEQALEAVRARMREELEGGRRSLERLLGSRGDALAHAGALSSALAELQGVETTFDRWHDDMKRLLDHNRQMHAKNDDFSQIVRQMVIVGLNASIEAAHAGHTGRGFGVVASEMRGLSARAEALSADYRRALYENDLITTTTFQDMQASGRMIIGALRGLDLTNRKGMEALAATAEAA
jgi:hypothetical protein